MTASRPPVVGCILAGGRSSRMGGGDKGLRLLDGRPMMARAIEKLAPDCVALVLNANGDPARFAAFALPVVADGIEGYAGPLAGVLAGLDWAAEHHPEAVFLATAAADTPFFPEHLVEALLDAAATPETIVIAASEGGRHPVFGLWPTALREDLRRFLVEGETRKVLAYVDRHPHADMLVPPLRAGDALVDPFFNVNTPEDLAAAEAIAAALGDAPAGGGRQPLVFGVAGWKNSGKTTLVTRLVANLSARGLSVATVKHAHHAFDIDQPGTDSYRHRQAGAREVALVSTARVAIMTELASPADEPPLKDVLKRLRPSDVVVVEGYKREPIPKVEVRRREARRHDPLAPDDPTVVAIAADHPVDGATVPVFDLDDVAGLADFLLRLRTRAP